MPRTWRAPPGRPLEPRRSWLRTQPLRPRQASLGPRRFACIRGLRRAHRGPGGYCRHSGNQGTTGRPARAHNTLQKISLRTRLSKPGEPREGFFPREGPLLERASRMLPSISPRIKPKGSARPPALRGSFPSKQALSPRQSAHGLCALRRVTGAPTRGDDSAAVAVLMYKAVKRGCTKQRSYKNCHFGDKGTVCCYTPRTTSPWGAS